MPVSDINAGASGSANDSDSDDADYDGYDDDDDQADEIRNDVSELDMTAQNDIVESNGENAVKNADQSEVSISADLRIAAKFRSEKERLVGRLRGLVARQEEEERVAEAELEVAKQVCFPDMFLLK